MPAARSERFSPRDSPHRSNSAVHPFPSRSAGARSRPATHDPALHAEKFRSTSEEQLDDEGTFESDVSPPDYARGVLRDSKTRRVKVSHKERGSLRRAFRDDDLPSRNRNRDTPAKPHAHTSKQKIKLKAQNRTRVEVFIPSTVSVGNLARILGVSLGRPHFVRQHFEFSLP